MILGAVTNEFSSRASAAIDFIIFCANMAKKYLE